MDGFLDLALDLKKDLNVIMRGASKASHMCFEIYRKYGTKPMQGQLYHDSQQIFSDLYQNVARRQVDSTIKCRNAHTFQLGTDRQEVEFGGVRTENHNRSMTASRLPESLAHELEIREVYSPHAHLR